MVALLLVAMNVTTAVVGDSFGVIAETIETLTSDESQDQEDLDATETVPSYESTETTETTETSDETEAPAPVPAPLPEEDAASAYPVIPQDYQVTAPDGTVISLTGSFPETTTIEAADFASDYVANIIAGYDLAAVLPENISDPKNPVTISFPFETDAEFAICDFADGTTPAILEDYTYADGILTITLSDLHPFVIAELLTPGSEDGLTVESIDAVIYEDSTYAAVSDDDMQITVTGILPEGTTAKAYPVESDDENVIVSYDITLFDENGFEYQPEFGAVSVTFTGSVIEDAIDENTELSIEHEDSYGNIDQIDCDITAGDTITFDAESFSTYRVVKTVNTEDELDGKTFVIVGLNNFGQSAGKYKYLVMTDNLCSYTQNNVTYAPNFLQSINVSNYYDTATDTIVDCPNEGDFTYWTFTKCDLTASVADYPNASITLRMKNGPSQTFTFTDSNRPQLYYISNGTQYLAFNYDAQTSNGFYQGFDLVDTPTPLIVVFAPDGSGQIAIGDYCPNPSNHAATYSFIRARDQNRTTYSNRGFEHCWPENNESGSWLSLAEVIPANSLIAEYDYNPVNDSGVSTVSSLNFEEFVDRSSMYTIKDPSDTLGNSNDGWYYESVGNVTYRYKFSHWEDTVTGTQYDPGDVIDPSTISGAMLSLKAVWELEYEYVMIDYDINIPAADRVDPDDPNAPPGAETYIYPEIEGYDGAPVEIRRYPSGANNYLVKSLTENYYNYKSGVQNEIDRQLKFSALFTGWQAEDGSTILQPGIVSLDTFFNQISKFDKSPKDGIITLKAKWSKNKSNSVSFTLMQNVIEVNGDPENEDSSITTHTDHVFSTAVITTNANDINTGDIKRNFIAPYTMLDGTNVLRTSGADEYIRSSLNTPITGDPKPASQVDSNGYPTAYDPDLEGVYENVTFQLVDLIDDEEVFAMLRERAQADVDNGTTKNTFYYIDGSGVRHNIEPEKLDSEHFTIRWYVLKYQGSGGWRIDGKLIRNGSYFAVKKTFVGLDQATIDAMTNNADPNDYFIEVVQVTDDDPIRYKLKIEPSPNAPTDYVIDDSGGVITYGYQDYDPATFTYTWIVQVEHEGTYKVYEYNYELADHGVIFQYRVDSLDDEDDVPVQQWTTYVDIEAKAMKATIDSVTVDDVDIVNLKNSYVKYGVFTIEKIDSDTNGTPMEDVPFRVWVVPDGVTSEDYLAGINNGTITDQPLEFVYYQDPDLGIWMYKPGDARVNTASITTDAEGKVAFKIPYDFQEGNRFLVVEDVPEGYDDSVVPAFEIEVTTTYLDGDPNPNYDITNLTPAADLTSMSIPFYNDANQFIGNTDSWVMIKNKPETVTVNVNGNALNSVENSVNSFAVTIVGKFVDNDEIYKTQTVVLDQNNSWTFTKDYPAMNGNREIYYTVTETAINGEAPDATKWDPIEKDNEYINGNSVTILTGDDSVISAANPDDLGDARTVNVDILHYLTNVPRVTIDLYNLDFETNNPLQGGVFEIYKKSPTGAEELFFINTNEKADLMRRITLDSADPEKIILFEGTYFIRQITAPDDYNEMTGILKITIDSNLNVVFEESPRNINLIDYDTTADPSTDTINVLFYNTRPPAAPTGYISFITPMLLLMVGGVLLFIISGTGFGKEDKDRKIRKVKNTDRLKEVTGSG